MYRNGAKYPAAERRRAARWAQRLNDQCASEE